MTGDNGGSTVLDGIDVIDRENTASGGRRLSVRQEQVLDVVETVYRREGIGGVRIGELAREASCSRSTLYELAPSKEGLLLLVLDRMMRRIIRHGAVAIEQADGPREQMRAMMLSGALDFGALGPHFLAAVRENPAARLLFERRIADGLEVLRGFIDEAVRLGQFRAVNSVVVAEAIFAVVQRFTDPMFMRTTRTDSSASLATLVDVLLDGLCPRA
jgi:AcrR family transcriptional regulator